ncbi:putative ribosomal export protein Nmd3 [Helianthus anomalus]
MKMIVCAVTTPSVPNGPGFPMTMIPTLILKHNAAHSRHDKQLVSHDIKSNNYYNYKFTFFLSKFAVRILFLSLRSLQLVLETSGRSSFVCTKISNNIALLDPLTLRHCFLDAERAPFTTSLLSSKKLVEYVVLDVDPPISSEVNVGGS